MGSALYSHIKNNKLESKGSSITEGIGTGRITQNFDKALVDDAFQTDDTEALNLVYDLIENQKIILGGSSGINIAGAIKLAKQLGPGKTIVTIMILCYAKPHKNIRKMIDDVCSDLLDKCSY